jgi:hypothetical protein
MTSHADVEYETGRLLKQFPSVFIMHVNSHG